MSSYERTLRRANKRRVKVQIDVSQPVVGYDDEPLTIPGKKGEAEEQLTLKKAVCDALMGTFRDEEKVSGTDKVKRFELARKVHRCEGPFEFSLADIELVKEMTAKMYATIVSGAVWDMLTEQSGPVVEA